MADYIALISDAVNNLEIEKTGKLLKELKNQPFEIKLEVLHIFALAPDITALNLMPFLVKDEYIDGDIYDRTIQLLIDRAHLNFHFSLILYDILDRDMILKIIPLMKHILINETDFEVLKKTIKTAGEYKISDLVDDISEFIFYDERKLKAEAVKALETISSETAYKNLLKAADSSKCDHDILNALVTIKNDQKGRPDKKQSIENRNKQLSDEISLLNEGLLSKDINERFSSFRKLAEMGEAISDTLAENLGSENHDLVIMSLNLISRTLPNKLVPDIFVLLGKKKLSKNIKFAAYTALESFPELKSVASVTSGIDDPSFHIRLASIKVLDKNMTDLVMAGIKEKIESGQEAGKKTGETILDAHAENLIVQLMVSDTFSYIISNYFEKKASIDVIKHYIEIQKKRNLNASAKKYEKMMTKKGIKERPFLTVISSSAIRIKVYTKILFDAGFAARSFQSAQAAFEFLMTEKPSGVICDLFLNDMTGLDLLKEIRDIHTKNELPFILATIQKDFINKEHDIIAFPPNTNQIHSYFK